MSIVLRIILWLRSLFTRKVPALPEAPVVWPEPVKVVGFRANVGPFATDVVQPDNCNKPTVGVTPAPAPPLPPFPGDDRVGTFIIPDIYPKDLGPNPLFHVLPGLVVLGKEVIGCYVKASEGLSWGKPNEDWFRRAWQVMDKVRDERKPGTEFFRGAYHFLRFSADGAKQADYCLNLIESAGGFHPDDLMLWCDIEEGGQGTWAGGEKLEAITDTNKRHRLADEITKCAVAFVARVKQRYPGMKVGIYGRGVFRDLQMTNARFWADAVCNPAYTRTMPPMDKYGWPLEDIVEWQLSGDGLVVAAGYPSLLPGWGATDYSVVLNGAHAVRLSDVRRRCLAR